MEFETFKWIGASLGYIGLVLVVWGWVVEIRRLREDGRLDRETYEKRPLLPEDKVAVMRPGDTVLLMPSLDDMTLDQQTRLVDAIKRMAERAHTLGIEFIVVPDMGQKAVVVARSPLSEHPAGNDADVR